MDIDQALLAAREGDTAARERLLACTRPYALRWASGLVDDGADDVVQDALVEAWTNLDRLREPAAYLSWVRLLVRKHADRHRRRKRPAAGLELVNEMASLEMGPDGIVVREDQQQIVRRVLAVAPDADRRLLDLRYSAGWSADDLAQLLDISPGAVRKRLFDARKRLRPQLLSALDLPQTERTPPMTYPFGRITEVTEGHMPDLNSVLDTTPLATGIRVFDALLPWPRAGLIDLAGPVGTGQLVLLGEVLTALQRDRPSSLVGVCTPGRGPDGSSANLHKIVEDEAGQPERTAIFRGEAEPALAAGIAMAGQLARDGVTVLLVLDRGVCDGVGLDVLGRLPLAMAHGSVTVIRTAPWARDADRVPGWDQAHTHIMLSAALVALGQFPAVDLLASRSGLADPELGAAARRQLEQARNLHVWLAQPFVTAEPWTGIAGERATPHESITTLKALLVPHT